MGGVRAQGMEAMHARRGYNQFGAFVEQHHVVRFLRACRLKWISVHSLLFFQRRTASCRSFDAVRTRTSSNQRMPLTC